MRRVRLFARAAIAMSTMMAAVLVVSGCAAPNAAEQANLDAKAAAVLKSSFVEHGQAKLDRLDQDETQRLCTQAGVKPPSKEVAEKIEKLNLAMIKWPADGNYLGDWKNGEKIAQEGRGKQFSDDPAGPVGGNCYACHQLSKSELAFGTIGPSLYRYLERRGNTAETQKYTYAKIYNSEAFSACSNMPRFGMKGILSEQQIKDVAALLLDPNSPVNQ